MYKSSYLTLFFKYIFPVIALIGMSFSIFITWVQSSFQLTGFTIGMMIVSVWMLIILFRGPFFLKRITATEDGISFRNPGKEIFIDYKFIDSVYKFDINYSWGIIIKYKDNDTGKHRKILYMPSSRDHRPFKDDLMTEYIKKRSSAENENYQADTVSAMIKRIAISMAMGLPVLALALYFMINQ